MRLPQAKVRGIMQWVSDFEVDQNEYNSECADMLVDMKSENKIDSVETRSALATFSAETSGALGSINTHALHTEQAMSSNIGQRRVRRLGYHALSYHSLSYHALSYHSLVTMPLVTTPSVTMRP